MITKEISISTPPPYIIPYNFFGKIKRHSILYTINSFLFNKTNSPNFF